MIISVILVCSLICAYVVWSRSRQKGVILPPSCTGELPILGHAHMLLCKRSNLLQQLKTISNDCVSKGGVTYFKLFSDVYYIIADPEDVLTVANTCLQKLFIYDFLSWLGNGLITGPEAIWQHRRKILNPVFSLPVIHGFLEVFNSQARQLVTEMEVHEGKGAFDHMMLIRNLILKITCLNTFGENGLKDNEFNTKYVEAVDNILFIVTSRVLKFWFHNDTCFKWFGQRTKQDELEKTLNNMSDEILRKKREMYKNINKEETFDSPSKESCCLPFLDRILKKNMLDDKAIKEEIDTMIVAGFETTSNLIIFATVMIGSYPEVQERLYQEIMNVLGEDRDVEKEDLHKLVYLDAVIKETLRVLPPAPVLGRHIHVDVKLKNFTLPANSDCIILPIGLHNQSSWGDAEQFQPERWLTPETLPVNPNTFAAFGVGKRSCIGKTYAMTSVKVILSHLLRNYRITADHRKMQMQLSIALKPDVGHEISLQKRI